MIARTIFVAVVAIGLGCAACSAESPVQRKEILRAPGFDDVSGFDDSDIKQIDDWLREQVALAQYPASTKIRVQFSLSDRVMFSNGRWP